MCLLRGTDWMFSFPSLKGYKIMSTVVNLILVVKFHLRLSAKDNRLHLHNNMDLEENFRKFKRGVKK